MDFPVGIADEYKLADIDDPNAFWVRAKGNSMEPEIREGDYLLIAPNRRPENGNIVLAKIGDEVTVKKFYKHPKHIVLQPLNLDHEPIFINDPDLLHNMKIYPIVEFRRPLL